MVIQLGVSDETRQETLLKRHHLSLGLTILTLRQPYLDRRHSLCRSEIPPVSSVTKHLAMIAKIKAISDLADTNSAHSTPPGMKSQITILSSNRGKYFFE